MKEKPIIFTTEMVEAILGDRKTQTRRILKGGFDASVMEHNSIVNYGNERLGTQYYFNDPGDTQLWGMKCSYGEVHDFLWVRENFFAWGWWIKEADKWRFVDFTPDAHGGEYLYKAPEILIIKRQEKVMGWHKRSSIHMPRNASRLLLRIVDIHPERLQSISPKDAIAEGVEATHSYGGAPTVFKNYITGIVTTHPEASFYSLWCKLHGLDSWSENPWVWVIQFAIKK